MIVQIAFTVVLILSCAYAAVFGGRAGRWGAGMLFAAAMLTWLVGTQNPDYQRFHLPLFIVDASLLIGLVALALQTRRRWPIWVSGLHANAVASHVAVALSDGVLHDLYYAMMSIWGLPIMIILAWGTALDRRGECRPLPVRSGS